MNDSMLAVFISMTISFEKLNEAKINKTTDHAASISDLLWYFAYTVPYNLGNNVWTYSESHHPCFDFQLKKFQRSSTSSSISREDSRYWHRSSIRKSRTLFLQRRQPHSPRCNLVEVHGCILWMDCLQMDFYLFHLPRNSRENFVKAELL